MEKIRIFIATVTGNAELVAEDVAEGLGTSVETEILLMDDVTWNDVAATTLAIFVSSTYGVGDVPDNGAALYLDLQLNSPDLSGLTYGAVSLGDSTYSDTFAFGGRKWDALATECGATRLGEVLILDASSNDDPQDLAIAWAEAWCTQLLELRNCA